MSSAYLEGSASSWGDLQISQNAIGYVPYRDYHIAIYEGLGSMKPGADNKGASIKYYCTPIVLLNPASAKYQYNQVSEQHLVMIDVLLWDQQIENQVIEYMKKWMKITVDESQIQVIPFEELILRSSVASNLYQCPSNWQLYQLHNSVKFKLTCATMSKGQALEQLLTNDPEQFTSVFNIKFSLATRKSQRRETLIRVDNVLTGKMFAKLDQRFPTCNEVLLTADDAKQLIAESASSVILETFSENEVISPASESEIYRVLERLVIAGQKAIDTESSSAWDSVFWNEDNYRPDKICSTLNESYNKSDKATQQKILQTMSDAKKTTVELGASMSIPGMVSFESKHGVSNENSHSNSTERDQMHKELGESLSKVAWNGEKFVPKPMQLTRLNLASVRNRQEFRDVKTTVTYTQAILTLPVNIPRRSSGPAADAAQPDDEARVIAIEKRLVDLTTAHEKRLVDLVTDHEKRLSGRIEKLEASLIDYASKVPTKFVCCFSAFRSAPCNSVGVIAYSRVHAQVGSAMNANTGTFTAPVGGSYFFTFRAAKDSADAVFSLLVNGSALASAFNGTRGNVWTIGDSISAVLSLNKGDQVAASLDCGQLYGDCSRQLEGRSVSLKSLTSFSGFYIG